MNVRIVGRMAWKDCRALAAFWLALFVFVAVGQLLVFAFPGHRVAVREGLAIGAQLALVAAAFYALGAAATIFAVEHEEGTFGFLDALPVTWKEVFCGKLLFAVASVAGLLLSLWLTAGVAAQVRGLQSLDFLGEWLAAPFAGLSSTWSLWGVAIVEAIAWGTLCSLLVKRPLQAVVVSVAGLSFTVNVLLALFNPGAPAFEPASYLPLVAARLVIAAVVFSLAVGLARIWMRPLPASPPGSRADLKRAATAIQTDTGTSAPSLASRGPYRGEMLLRLVWQTARQSKRLMLIFTAIVAACLPLMWLLPAGRRGQPIDWIDVVMSLGVVVIVWLMVPASVFAADQENRQYRFFAEKGIGARQVWLSRHLVWLPFMLLIIAVTHTMFHYGWWSRQSQVAGFRPPTVEEKEFYGGRVYRVDTPAIAALSASLAGALLIYGAGQLCSMLVRSGILALVLGGGLSLALIGWADLMLLVDIPWWWSVMPLPACMLFFTWLEAPDWVNERRGWRTAVRALVLLVLPMAAIVVAAREYRIREVPLVALGFDVSPDDERPPTAAAKAVREQYEAAGLTTQRAWKDPEGNDPESYRKAQQQWDEDWARMNEAAIQSALAASRGEYQQPLPFDRHHWGGLYSIARLLIVSAQLCEREGRLDAAWERYLAALRVGRHMAYSDPNDNSSYVETHVYQQLPGWGAARGQTAARISRALAELIELQKTYPPAHSVLERRYRQARSELSRPEMDKRDYFRWMELTGERERALHGLDFVTQQTWENLRQVEEKMAADLPLGHKSVTPNSPQPPSWLRTTYLRPDILAQSTFHMQQSVLALLQVEIHRRAVCIVLAIEQYRLDNKSLPKSLDELSPKYLDRVPHDPFSARAFVYEPNGVATAISGGSIEGQGWTVAEHEAFIWTPGTRVQFGSDDVSTLVYREANAGHGKGDWRYARDDHERWISGWGFPIPAEQDAAAVAP